MLLTPIPPPSKQNKEHLQVFWLSKGRKGEALVSMVWSNAWNGPQATNWIPTNKMRIISCQSCQITDTATRQLSAGRDFSTSSWCHKKKNTHMGDQMAARRGGFGNSGKRLTLESQVIKWKRFFPSVLFTSNSQTSKCQKALVTVIIWNKNRANCVM